MINSAWTHKNTTFWAITAVAVAILAGVVVDSVKRVGGLLARGVPQVIPQVRDPRKSAIQYRVSDIVSAHLFGQADALASQSKVKAPETRLNLKLLGVVAAEGNSGHGRAIIEVAGKGVKSYEIGQVLEHTDAKLKAVEVNRVLIDRKGVVESLPLKRDAVDVKSSAGQNTAMLPGVSLSPGENTSANRNQKPATRVQTPATQNESPVSHGSHNHE